MTAQRAHAIHRKVWRRRTTAAAERPRVEHSDGRLTVEAPKGWRYYSGWGGWRESFDVEIAMPAGSRFEGKAETGTLHCEGRLDGLRFKTGAGETHAEQTGSVTVRTGVGNVNIARAAGHVDRRCRRRAPDERRERQDRGRPAAQPAVFAKTANGDIVLERESRRDPRSDKPWDITIHHSFETRAAAEL